MRGPIVRYKARRDDRAARRSIAADLPEKDSQLLVALGTFAAGAGLILVSGWDKLPDPVADLFGQIGGLLIVAVAVGYLWELRGRAAFTRDLLSKVNLSQEVLSSGIVGVGDYYLQNVPWTDRIGAAKKIDISMAYGETWRNTYDHILREFVRRPGTRLRLILPDPRDSDAVREMARRFACTTADVQDKIVATTKAFDGYRQMADPTAGIDVRFRAGIPTFTYYRFDQHMVITMYSNRRDRTSEVPIIQITGGRLAKFLRDDFEAMLEQSQPADLSVVTGRIRRIRSRAS